MKNIAKSSVLVVSCIFSSEAMDSDFELVHFTGNDIRDNVISRDYSSKLKMLQMQSIKMFGGNQLPSIVASDCHAKNLLHRVEQEVEQDRNLTKEKKNEVKEKKKEEAFQRINYFIRTEKEKWDKQAEQFHMLELLPKLYTCIEDELLDIEIKREDLNICHTLKVDDELVDMQSVWMLLNGEKITKKGDSITKKGDGVIKMLVALKKLMSTDLLRLNSEKYKDYRDYYIQKIMKLEDCCQYAQAHQAKYNRCFGNSNEYFIFIGNNPYKENGGYKIESILPRKYLHQQTKLAIVIPGDVKGHSVLVGQHTFFRLFHCNEQFTKNMRMKIIFTQTNGKKVGLPSDLSCMFDDFQYKGNGFKVVKIDFHGAYFPEPIRNMSSMFRNCKILKKLDLSSFDTSKVISMEQMFCFCQNLQELDLSNFNTKNVESMSRMFYQCENLKSLHLSNFDTSNVVSMDEMFCFCQNLQELDLSNFNTKNVEGMSRMFYQCKNLTVLDLSNFDVSNVRHITDMFAGCKNLAKIKLKQSTLKQLLQQNEKLFEDCTNLQIIYA